METLALRHLHVGCVIASGAGFVLRAVWRMRDSPMLAHPAVRVLPHVIDTMLLTSAVVLAMRLRQYPFVHGWLTAKVCGLVAYIVLGSIAIKRGRTPAARTAAFAGAIAVYAYVVSVALTKSVLPHVF